MTEPNSEMPPERLIPGAHDPDRDLPPDDIPTPTPWTREQTEAWNVRHNAFPPGGAIAFEKRMREDQDRLATLRGKGAARMTPAEKDEALDLMLRGAR